LGKFEIVFLLHSFRPGSGPGKVDVLRRESSSNRAAGILWQLSSATGCVERRLFVVRLPAQRRPHARRGISGNDDSPLLLSPTRLPPVLCIPHSDPARVKCRLPDGFQRSKAGQTSKFDPFGLHLTRQIMEGIDTTGTTAVRETHMPTSRAGLDGQFPPARYRFQATANLATIRRSKPPESAH
jgi:hypothetical protein